MRHSRVNEVDEHIRRSGALLSAIRDMERQERVGALRAGSVGSRLTMASRAMTTLVVGVLLLDGWLAIDAFTGKGPDSPTVAATDREPSYSDLEIFAVNDRFAGRITVRNPTELDVEALVEVDLYVEGQNVGDVTGSVTLKPGSESVVELDGFDSYVEYTDARVDLLALPK